MLINTIVVRVELEFINFYSGPMASPDKAIELLFSIHNYDGNGYISIWEMLTVCSELLIDKKNL